MLFAVAFYAGGYAADRIGSGSKWAVKWRYVFDKSLIGAEYRLNKPEHDCDFWSAPIGRKYCHYERVISTVRVLDGKVSYDEGRTWVTNSAEEALAVRPLVTMTWVKVQD